jgi:hypothetical protein
LRKNLIEIKKLIFVHLALMVLEIFKDLAMFLGFWPKFDPEMKVKNHD